MYEVIWVVMGLFMLLIPGGVIYLIFRPRDHAVGNAGRDALFYIIMFIALVALYWGIADLGRIILDNAWKPQLTQTSTTYGNIDTYSPGVRMPIYYPPVQDSSTADLRKVSLRISAIVVSIPIFVFAWYMAVVRRKDQQDYCSKRSYALAIVVLTSMGLLIQGVWLVYHLFNYLLNVAETDVRMQMSVVLPYFATTLGVWAFHLCMLKKSEIHGSIPTAPTAPKELEDIRDI